jgi:hypothetical protein
MENRGKGQKESLGNEEEKTCEDCDGKAKVRDRRTLCSPGGIRIPIVGSLCSAIANVAQGRKYPTCPCMGLLI